MDLTLDLLHNRFLSNTTRHSEIDWSILEIRISGEPKKLEVLRRMEETGGEPDVIDYDPETGRFLFVDCAPESPVGRRSLCYDRQAWETRKSARPDGNALDMAQQIGIQILDEELYRKLQTLGEFDTKTSSWILTTPEVRRLGGALFMDRRFDRVFVYHNGAESYYGARGFRGFLWI